ncbi:hypothetical protein GTA08_BOTSDO08866 [Neofusicoccum parvum]|uniref:Uncharacterized protein n=1 Tax=Neofusicoccum parvum TaxID=310453 RepID=A0ACB5RR04_9PEZI|nr:hypothetical protein GTA08_BOTSDO08866 [Neofusicoccum parvum]GME45993.1 hypothetical protein GTA08_BOTSDO08866 [Neofusicoccum parvum]
MAPALNPIDYYIPVVNRGITIRASSITCMLVALIAVALRLWTRWKMVRALGWDDLFVALAAIFTLFGCITLNNEVPNGLGLHERTIVTENADGSLNYDTYETYFMWFYFTNAAYAATTSSIKLSLLFQYLRLFPKDLHPRTFYTCLGLIGVVTTWGVSFLFLIIFACNPVDKSWHLTKEGKCIMFGDFHPKNAYAAYASQTASNMFLDTVILIVPIPSLYKLSVGRKQKIGLMGLFSAGTLVVICASLRLWLVVKSKAGTYPTVDPPWYAPPIILMSVLEVNLAILTASMPIFWPYLASIGTSGIKVMQEVIVRSEPRKNYFTTGSHDGGTEGSSLARNGGVIQRSNSDASDLRLQASNSGADSRASGHLPIGDKHRQYYGDPGVAELVVGDLKGDANVREREFVGGFERSTGNQAAAWFEPVQLEELEPKPRSDSKV